VNFYIGIHHPSTAWAFLRSMVSVTTLLGRKRDFRVNEWILDSGAFSQISRYGKFIISPTQYLEQIERWSSCGKLMAACTQDWMCESVILEKTGKSIEEHQELTVRSYAELASKSAIYILPVLQGFVPVDYVRHVRTYGNLLESGQWVGVGSICKRNGNPDAIEDVLLAIKRERSDLRLHGFGIKLSAMERPTVRAMLASCDSMAWSFHGRKNGKDAADPRLALRYAAQIEELIKEPVFIQDQLFEWWSNEEAPRIQFLDLK